MKIAVSAMVTGLAALFLTGCEPMTVGSPPRMEAAAPRTGNRVVVYYMHRTFRCSSCLWMEKTTRQSLQESFPSELANGRLELKLENYQNRQDLAKRYDVYTVSVLVVNVADGREVSYQDLDKVWELKGDSDKFRAYITEAVRAALGKTNPGIVGAADRRAS